MTHFAKQPSIDPHNPGLKKPSYLHEQNPGNGYHVLTLACLVVFLLLSPQWSNPYNQKWCRQYARFPCAALKTEFELYQPGPAISTSACLDRMAASLTKPGLQTRLLSVGNEARAYRFIPLMNLNANCLHLITAKARL